MRLGIGHSSGGREATGMPLNMKDTVEDINLKNIRVTWEFLIVHV